MSSKRKTAESVVPIAPKDGRQEGAGSSTREAPEHITVKRQRVSRACDQCRAAREKCDGIRPLCFPCVSQNRPCTYAANPKKRGVQTGYIRTLELALAWVFEKVPGSEDALSSLLTHEGGQGRSLLTGSDSHGASRLHQKWRRSRVHRNIDRILSGEESAGPRDHNSPSVQDASDTDGEAGASPRPSLGPESSSTASHSYSNPQHLYPITLPGGQGPVHSGDTRGGLPAVSLDPRSGAASGAPVRLRLPQNHWRLLDIYFSYTHCWLPILDKQEIFQASYLYPAGEPLDLSPDNPSSSAHAELWSALALASYQDVASSRPIASARDATSEIMSSTQIYNTARSMIPPDDGVFQIHHVRALILLSLVNLGRMNVTAAWLLIGKAVRIFLGLEARDGSDQDKQQQRFRSVFIACFIMDTMVSRQCRKPAHLTADDMVAAMDVSENDLDEWQPWAACDGFGPAADSPHVSRTPAFCRSTFNQLYGIFKVINQSMAIGRARIELDSASAVGVDQLKQAVSHQAPFGAYILSTAADSAPVPSPYLLKIVYLWASGLMDRVSSSIAQLMMAVVEQYHGRFGTCAMPPFLAACLDSWSNHMGFEHLDSKDRANLAALRASQTSMWQNVPVALSPNLHDRAAKHTASAYGNADAADRYPIDVPQATGSTVPFADSASPFTHSVLTGEQSSPGLDGHPLLLNNAAYTFPSYGNPTGLFSPTLTDPTRGDPRVAMSHMGTSIATDQAQAGVGLQPLYHLAPQSMLSVAPTSTVDYAALLDDLASIDYADRVETDPQFIRNLGFGPDCDVNEIMSLDFPRF